MIILAFAFVFFMGCMYGYNAGYDRGERTEALRNYLKNNGA